jgi:hypothetical protein
VSVLSDQGVGSLDAAASALGRVMTYVMEHHSADTAINGLHIKYFLEANPASQRFVDGVRWLRDWCGVDLPARGGIMRSAARTSAAPRKSLDTLEMDLKIACHLEYVGVYHPSPFVRGHAGGWSFMGRSMMRFEQSTSSCINSLVAHSAFGLDVTVASVSLCRDKHPDPAKQRPRPAWAALDGLADQQAILAPLREMLAGREELQCILVDTDSPDGDPSHPATTQWLLDPLSSHRRADHSLHGLLRLAPLKMSAEQAARYHGHFAKRYLANVSKTSPDFSSAHRRDLGRFAGSSAQVVRARARRRDARLARPRGDGASRHLREERDRLATPRPRRSRVRRPPPRVLSGRRRRRSLQPVLVHRRRPVLGARPGARRVHPSARARARGPCARARAHAARGRGRTHHC